MRGRYHLRQAFKYKNLCSREGELNRDSLSCENITHRVSSLLGPDAFTGSSSVSLQCRADMERPETTDSSQVVSHRFTMLELSQAFKKEKTWQIIRN